MTRLPQIGDRVTRTVDGEIVFDGYVLDASDSRLVRLVAHDRTLDLRPEENCFTVYATLTVETLFLVRGLHGFRWRPHDLRPEAKSGDIVRWVGMGRRVSYTRWAHEASEKTKSHTPADYYAAVPEERMNCAYPLVEPSTYGWRVTGADRDTKDACAGSLEISRASVASALAGLDSWSWEPATWPKEK